MYQLSDVQQPKTTRTAQHLLALETSCDETAAAVVDRQRRILSNVVASQHALHQPYGGVVPEIASRAHVEVIIPVISQALQRAHITLQQVDVIAVTTQPGLAGSLLTGLTAAKTLAYVCGVPLVGVNHVHAHLYACQLSTSKSIDYPAVGLVVSGGHTHLFLLHSPWDYELLGATLDDAAGEAFDKAAQMLGLGHPGGPAIERAALSGNPQAFHFPRSLKSQTLQFSFSGIKTALLYEIKGYPGTSRVIPPLTAQRIADLAASYQAAIVDTLVMKSLAAVRQTNSRTLCVGGGVAANRLLRTQLQEECTRHNIRLVLALPELCTDNAAMAALGWEHYEREAFLDLDAEIQPGLWRPHL